MTSHGIVTEAQPFICVSHSYEKEHRDRWLARNLRARHNESKLPTKHPWSDRPDMRACVVSCVRIAQGYAGEEQLGEALKGADVIIIPAGVPRKPGMTRDDLFKVPPALMSAGA